MAMESPKLNAKDMAEFMMKMILRKDTRTTMLAHFRVIHDPSYAADVERHMMQIHKKTTKGKP